MTHSQMVTRTPTRPAGLPNRSRVSARCRLVDLSRPAAILVAARAFQTVVLVVARGSHPSLSLLGFTGWDGAWYQAAAEDGWPHTVPHGASTLAFFPGFPTAIRVVHAVLPLTWMRAELLAAAITELTMVLAFWILATDVWDKSAADRSTLVLCFLPGAFIFSLGYSEPLFLTFACLCLLLLRRRSWILAGVAAALAGATRSDGVALIACCAWASWIAVRERREWRSSVAVLVSPLGIVGWFAYLRATTGSWTAWFHAEKDGWGEHVTLKAPLTVAHQFGNHGFAYPNYWVTALSTVLAAILFVMLLRVRPPATLVIYTAIVLVLALFSIPLGLRPRFVLTAFPLCMAAGVLLRRWWLAAGVVCGAATVWYLLTLTVTGTTLVP